MSKITTESVVEFSNRGGDNLKRVFKDLVDLETLLASKSVEHAKALSEGMKKYKAELKAAKDDVLAQEAAFGKLQTTVLGLGRTLKTLKMGKDGLDLVSNKDIADLKKVNAAFDELGAHLRRTKKEQGIDSGTFGLNPKSIKEAVESLKVLEKAAESARGAMLLPNANQEKLRAFEIQIKKNTGALVAQAEALRQNQKIEDVWAQAHAANIARDKGLLESYEKIKRRAGVEDSERAKKREDELRRIGVINEQEVAKAEAIRRRADVEDKRIKAEGEALRRKADVEDKKRAEDAASFDGKQRSLRAALQGTAEGDVYGGRAGRLQTFTKSEFANPALLAQQKLVRDIQEQLIVSLETGNKKTMTHIRLVEQLVKEKEKELKLAKELATANNPAKTSVERSLERIGGSGGAALMAIQASLMANYSILSGITGSIRAAITHSVELEAAFRNVQAVTATTSTEMVGLESKIKSVAAGTKFSSVEMANAALILGQAGLSAKAIAETLPAVAMLAAASGTTLVQAVDLMTSVIGVFDKKATDASDVANKITAAANNSKVSVEKLAVGFQYAGNIAAQMGISFEEVTAAMSSMANAGIKSGSTMGTGLRQFLVETQKPSKEFLVTMERLGLSMSDLDFKTHGLLGVAKKLRDAGFVGSDAIKSFDVRGAAAFNALIANPEDMERQYKLLLDTKAGVNANEIQMQSFSAQSTRLTTSLGNMASEGLGPVTKLLTAMVGGFASLVQGVSESGIIVKTFTSLLVAVGTTGAIAYTVGLAKGFLALPPVLALTTSGLAGVKTALMSLSLASGVGIVLIALTAAYVGLSYVMSKHTADMDALKAKTAEAKAAFEEKAGAVKSLDARLESLSAREVLLRNDTKAVMLESQALTSEFGSLGTVIDRNNTSYDVLVTKLKRVRDAMIELRDVKLAAALITAKEEQVALVKDAQLKMDVLKNHGDADFLKKLVATKGPEIEKILGKPGLENIKTAETQIRKGSILETGATNVLSDSLKILAKELKNLDGESFAFSDSNISARHLENVAKRTGAYTIASAAEKTGKSNIEGMDATKVSIESLQTFKKLNTNFDKVFSASSSVTDLAKTGVTKAYARDRGITERAAMSPEDAKDTIKVAAVAKAIGFEMSEAMAKQARLVNMKGLSEADASGIKTIMDKAQGARRDDILRSQKGTSSDDNFRSLQTRAANEAELRKILSKPKADASMNARGEAVIRLIGADDLRKALTGLLPGEAGDKYEIAEFQNNRATEEKLETFRNRRTPGADTHTGSRIDKLDAQITERNLQYEKRKEERAAEADASMANLLKDEVVAKKLQDEAIGHLKAAGEADRKILLSKQSLARKQFADAKTAYPALHAQEDEQALADLADTWADKIAKFTQGWKGFNSAAVKRIQEMTDSLKQQEQSLLETKQENSDKSYERGERLRELERERDFGIKARVTTGISSTQTYSVTDKSSASPSYTDYDMVNGRMISNGKVGGGGSKDSTSAGASTTFNDKGVKVTISSSGTENGLTVGGSSTGRGVATRGSVDPALAGTPLVGTLTHRINLERIKLIKMDLVDNQKLLEEIGTETSGLIGGYTENIGNLDAQLKDVDLKLKELRAKAAVKDGHLSEDDTKDLKAADALQKQYREERLAQVANKNRAKAEQRTAREYDSKLRSEEAKNTSEIPDEVTLGNIQKKLGSVFETYAEGVRNMDTIKTIGDGMAGVLGTTTGSISTAFSSIVTGTKSVKEAFRDMATGMIKAMLDVVSQALAIQAMKGMLNIFTTMGSAYAGTVGGGVGGDAGISGAGGSAVLAATGGYINSSGVLERVRMMAGGGPVTGGTPGRDSVPILGMPGEFMMQKSAVDAVGTNYLHSLNAATNSAASSGSSGFPKAQVGGGGVTNVWVVSPDNKPTGLGPQDVIVVVSDDIARGGSIKKLIKSVQMGQI